MLINKDNKNARTSTISVIVPIYNAEKHLQDCIDSILAQSYPDWALILVDNGSTDRSLEICNSYSSKDKRIQVYRQITPGVSAARNMGLNNSIGEYIVFVDADDMLPQKSLELRLDAINNVDMVIGLHTKVDYNSDLSNICKKNFGEGAIPNDLIEFWSKETALKNIIVTGVLNYQGYCFNKMFRKEIIDSHHLRFSEDIMYNEDRLFCVEYVLNCHRVKVLKECIYYYRSNPEGAMSALKNMKDSNREKYLSDLVAYDRMIMMVKNKYPDCYFDTIAEAWLRTVRLKNAAQSSEKMLNHDLNKRMIQYAIRALPAPSFIISNRRKLSMIWHSLRKSCVS